MAERRNEFLTTRELAALLRIKERKVYDLAASGSIPCSRAMGKLLFPRAAVDAWLARHGSGMEGLGAGEGAGTGAGERPNVVLGSHDPLLDWALRESGSGLASFFDGSLDGLERFAQGEGIAAGLHVPAMGEGGDGLGWNAEAVAERFSASPVVLVEWAWRARGFLVAPGQAGEIREIADLRGRRVVPRQAKAGSQILLEHLMTKAALSPDDVAFTAPRRTETDAALAVLDGEAEVAFGLEGAARQFRLDFVPLVRERFDLLVARRAWFEPPWQRFLAFCGGDALGEKAEALGGYDLSGLFRVHFNGP